MTIALPMLILVLCLLGGVPIAVALAGSGMFGIWLITGDLAKVLNIVGLVPFSSVADYQLTTIPMFILMAYFSASSGLARDLYAAAVLAPDIAPKIPQANTVAIASPPRICDSQAAAA